MYHASVDYLRLLVSIIAACWLAGCGTEGENPLLWPPREVDQVGTPNLVLLARIVHLSDSHIIDIESPARYAGSDDIVDSAWRPWEAYAPQLLDGIVRAVNRIHQAGSLIDFVVHTGDICDNAQSNELAWAVGVMDGGLVEPLSGPDDRPVEARPAPLLDPYAAFQAQGLYCRGVHGDLPSIPWYLVLGNHDVYALGTFPIIPCVDGVRRAPLPLSRRLGVLAPAMFDPTGCWNYGLVTPAHPGPPALLGIPTLVLPNPARAYFDKPALKRALFGTVTRPPGHGFADTEGEAGWYSVSPAPGLRLIAVDTSDRPLAIPTLPYDDGCLSIIQREFLRWELRAAQERGELVIVASHYPSQSLEVSSGSAVSPSGFRDLLNECPNVVLHLAGHHHTNRVFDRNGYVEVQTCSTLALPQEGRVIEIWRDVTDGSVLIGYRMFSHLDESLPALGDDPLRALREVAKAIAQMDKAKSTVRRAATEEQIDPEGCLQDREGLIRLRR